jgi:ABC-2 type transport system permease protein
MIGTIVRKEFMELLRDGRFRWASLALIVLLVLSALSAWHNREASEHQRHEAGQSIHDGWLDQGQKSGHAATHYGNWALKPSTLLSALDPGVEPYAGTAVFMESHRRNTDRHRPAASGTSAQRFGSWSTAAILQVLVPLLIIIVAFPAFAGEREQGTLRQLASLGISMRPVAAGKVLGIAGALAAVLVPVTLLGALLLDPAPVFTLAAVYFAYFAVVLAVALAVSARAPSARTALVTLLGLWAVATLVVPRASSDVARHLHPVPSSLEFAQAIQEDLKNVRDGHGLGGGDPRAAALALAEGEAKSAAAYQYHYGLLFDTYEAQSRVHTLASLASPTMAVRALSMAVAGSDLQQHRRFLDAAETHRHGLVDALNAADASGGGGPGLWASIPRFSLEPAGLGAALAPYRPALFVLAGWLALAALLFWSLRRVRVS